MKKKLLFVIPEYSHGGTNKSLENLLHFINKDKYEISIYSLYEDGGDYYKKVFAPYIVKKSLPYHLAHDNKVTRKVMGALMKVSSKINFDWLYTKEINRLQNKYSFDTIIAFQEGAATEFVSYVKGNAKKVAWIHFDYAMLKEKTDLRKRMKFYDKYNHIVCVSQTALNSMLEVQPEYKEKSLFIYNIIDTDTVKKSAEDIEISLPYNRDVFNILSIGRFVDIKQFHLIPAIAKTVKEHTNKRFCWYIMGSGEMNDIISQNIIINDVQECVKIINAKDNPYPYFKNANLHVCTSTHESFSYTIAESKILHTPVLCNDFAVSEEVVDANTGWTCNIKDMSLLLIDIINNMNGCYTQKQDAISNYRYDNTALLNKLYQIL